MCIYVEIENHFGLNKKKRQPNVSGGILSKVKETNNKKQNKRNYNKMNYSGAYNTFTPTLFTATQELTKGHSGRKKEYKSLGCFIVSPTHLLYFLLFFAILHNTQNGTRHTIAIQQRNLLYLWNKRNQKLVESFFMFIIFC